MKKKKFDYKKAVIWVLTMMFSIAAIFIGNRIASDQLALFSETEDVIARGEVTEILETDSERTEMGGDAVYESTSVLFTCRFIDGGQKGDTVTCIQTIDGMYAGSQYVKEVEPGDRVVLMSAGDLGLDEEVWQFSDYYRFDKILILGFVFMGLILILGRWKGVNTLLSLVFTFSFVFFVFVPSVMNGFNAYISAAITCVFTIIMTLVLINSISRKTIATIIGCAAGTLIAAAGTCIMSEVLNLTGFIDEHSYYLSMLNPDQPVDLTAVIFAAIVIGALGAIMDVAMDISSSLHELSVQVPDISFRQMCVSGMNIGRDVMGTMANTLVLAYIGSSLSGIMILLAFSTSIGELLNKEVIIVELLQALIGSLAILLTIPCTVLICASLYLGKGKKRQHRRREEPESFADNEENEDIERW